MPNNFQAWGWWIFSVIFVGILINLVSSYLKPSIDKVISKYSDTRRIKSKKQRGKINKRIKLLLSDPMEVVIQVESITWMLVLFTFLFLIGIGMSSWIFMTTQFGEMYSNSHKFTRIIILVFDFSFSLFLGIMILTVFSRLRFQMQVIGEYRKIKKQMVASGKDEEEE